MQKYSASLCINMLNVLHITKNFAGLSLGRFLFVRVLF